MPIYSMELAPKGSAEATTNERFENEYVRRYIAVSDLTDNEAYVRDNLPGISRFSAYPFDAFARCKSIRVGFAEKFYDSEVSAALLAKWDVEVMWGYINPFTAAESGDPVDCPIEVSIEGVVEQQPADEDKDGNPVVNSANDYFDPPVERDFQRIRINIARYERSVDASRLLLDYALHKNSAPWQGFPAGTVKLAVPRITPAYSQNLNVIRWHVQYAFEVNPDTWKKKVLDQGFRAFDTNSNKLKAIVDEYGQPLQSAALLDGNGAALALPATKDNISVLEFDIYPDADFNDFGFPADIMSTSVFA